MKEKVGSILAAIQKMNEKYEFRTLEEKAACIQEKINEFALKILFAGEFSAGKSALINAVLGEELLEEGQRPETAIASEIRYDTDEYIEAVSGGISKRYSVEDIVSIDTAQYDYLIWHLMCDELQQYEDCTIVDMPGFNSGIKDHNKAILQYAGKGNAYILVIDCESGSIKQNMANFMNEIKNYNNNMAIAITKTDLKTDEDIQKVKEGIVSSAEMLFGEDVLVITTSKYDNEVRDKIRNLFRGFDREKIFMQEFVPQVYDIGVRCVDSMETYKESMKLDVSQFDQEIAKHEKAKKDLSVKLKSEKGKLENRFRNSVGPAIMADAENALSSHSNDLAKALKAGEKNFSMEVNNILRPVLLTSTQQYVEQNFSKFIQEIDFSGRDMDISVQDLGINALEKYRQANSKVQELAQNGSKFNALYKTITTTLAVATTAIAPLLELIIIFLPDIFRLFGIGKQEESLQDKVRREMIPQIAARMEPEIDKTLMEMKEEMLLQVEAEINDLIDIEMESLEAAKEKKEKMSEAFDKKINEVQRDIDEINNLIAQMG